MQKSIFFLAGALSLALQPVHAATPPTLYEVQTNVGTMTFKLDFAKAPITANNFYNYVKSGFYRNTLMHRTIKGFVTQGGGVNRFDGKLKTTLAPIKLESQNGLSNKTATVAMARTDQPNSATSQFFVNLKDNLFLDYASPTSPGYAVFGSVIDGMDIVRKIENLPNSSDVAFTPSASVVYIENVYSVVSVNPNQSITRIIKTGSGTVTSVPAGINCGTACTFTQPKLGIIKLTATPTVGYSFSGWTGDCYGDNRAISLDTLKGNHNCTANFTKDPTVAQ